MQIASNKGSQMSVHTYLAHTVFKKIFRVHILKAGDNIFLNVDIRLLLKTADLEH